MTNASITRKLFWLERPQKHYADQVRHPGGGHGVRGDGAVLGLPFIFAIGVAAAFMALIVRVIKNAFAQAVKMKDELDYTV